MKNLANLMLATSLCWMTTTAIAETHEVLMKNRGAAGPMVYEPDYLEIQPGDMVKFIRKHKSHNAASIPELSPEGYVGFMGKIDEEIEITYDTAGFYGIKCTPHYAQGMVMIIKVGEAELPEVFRTFKAPGVSDQRLKKIISKNIDKTEAPGAETKSPSPAPAAETPEKTSTSENADHTAHS